MNNQKLSSSFETLNSENDDRNRSRSVSPEITKFEEPGMFVLLDEEILDEEILANRKGSHLGSSIRDIHPKAINLPNVGVVILHQEDPKMKVEESNGEMKSLTRRTRTSAVKPDVALEWSNIQIKFRVVSQDFYSNNDLYDLYPDVDPQSPSYQEDIRKNANSEQL